MLRLYVEDYVNTYLKRLKPTAGQNLRVGLLLGNREIHEDMPYVFVDGAMEMEILSQEGEKVVFTEEAWKKAYQQVETMFPRRTVQGWFLCAGEGVILKPFKLLEAAQPVFYREKPADVFKQWTGRGRSYLYYLFRWFLPAAWIQYLL